MRVGEKNMFKFSESFPHFFHIVLISCGYNVENMWILIFKTSIILIFKGFSMFIKLSTWNYRCESRYFSVEYYRDIV